LIDLTHEWRVLFIVDEGDVKDETNDKEQNNEEVFNLRVVDDWRQHQKH
jgi:hypothetical protein